MCNVLKLLLEYEYKNGIYYIQMLHLIWEYLKKVTGQKPISLQTNSQEVPLEKGYLAPEVVQLLSENQDDVYIQFRSVLPTTKVVTDTENWQTKC